MVLIRFLSLSLLLIASTLHSKPISNLTESKLIYWQNKVSQYPELVEPKIMLSFHYLQQAKLSGRSTFLQQSCQYLIDGLNLQPIKNGVKLAVNLTNYQHDFILSEQLSQYYLSHWPYDSQVYLWRLQGAIFHKDDRLIHELSTKLNALSADFYTWLAKADVAAYQKNINRRVSALKQAVTLAKDNQTRGWVWLQLAIVHLDWKQDLALADNALSQANILAPNNPDILRHRIEWFLLSRQYNQASDKLTQLADWHWHPELILLRKMIDNQTEPSKIVMSHESVNNYVCRQPLIAFLKRVSQ